MRCLGILTSGGDAPGMNAAIRAAVCTAHRMGVSVLGIVGGYRGLLEGTFAALTPETVTGIIQQGGTILKTARCDAFFNPDGRQLAAAHAEAAGVDALLVIGGDGSFRGLCALLAESGLRGVGIPCTIDNDVEGTEYTVGFDTAANTATEAVDRLRDTSMSHGRCSVVEVMGRRSGALAREIGAASAAEAVFAPDMEAVPDEPLFERLQRDGHSIVVVAEGFRTPSSADIAALIRSRTGVATRLTVLGHIQRGGAPTARDRVTATAMGIQAVELLQQGASGQMMALRRGRIRAVALPQGEPRSAN